uniref:Uncharacterized protein n=1 Tax=Ciona intestinalis TaxID=7719 RepID=H2XQT0_CIOIN
MGGVGGKTKSLCRAPRFCSPLLLAGPSVVQSHVGAFLLFLQLHLHIATETTSSPLPH